MTDTDSSPEGQPLLTLTMSADMADLLWHTGSKNLLADFPDRFEEFPQFADAYDPIFANGYMRWCRTAADAVLLLAFDLASGHAATMLSDVDLDDARVILSTRPY